MHKKNTVYIISLINDFIYAWETLDKHFKANPVFAYKHRENEGLTISRLKTDFRITIIEPKIQAFLNLFFMLTALIHYEDSLTLKKIMQDFVSLGGHYIDNRFRTIMNITTFKCFEGDLKEIISKWNKTSLDNIYLEVKEK